MTGATLIDDLKNFLAVAGFGDIQISSKDESAEFIRTWAPGSQIENYFVSATIEAVKPADQSLGG